MESLPSDVKKLILENLTGVEIIKLSSSSKAMHQIRYNDRYIDIWKLKIIEDFGIEPKTKKYYQEYIQLYKEFGTICGYPEISHTYKNVLLYNKLTECEFLENVLKLRKELPRLNIENRYKYFTNYWSKYNLSMEQYTQLLNIFDFYTEYQGNIAEHFVENENQLIH